MWRNALGGTVAMLVGLILLAMTQLDFLLPYKRVLVARYSIPALVYVALLSVNLFGLFFLITRKLLLKDTGRKLVHLEKSMRAGEVARDLSERLEAAEDA